MDELLTLSGLETQLLQKEMERWLSEHQRVSGQAQQNHLMHSRRALRCDIARILYKEEYRGFAARLADSPLLQYFCKIGEVDRVRVPAKSTLQRYAGWWQESEVREIIHNLLNLGATAPQQLKMAQPLDLETCFLDSTCLSVNIHYPVRLGVAARRHLHLDAERATDPRSGAQAPDGRAEAFCQSHQQAVHGHDPRLAPRRGAGE